MNYNYDRLLASVLLLSAMAHEETIDATILLFERAGFVDHTYVERDGKVDIKYRFTAIAERFLRDVEEEIQ